MDFTRKLENVKRVLSSMGPLNFSRLNNEDTICMLMKKLPHERLKWKWTDVAGDLICSKGLADFSNFVNFIQKQTNHFGEELKSSLPQHNNNNNNNNDNNNNNNTRKTKQNT